MDVTSQTLQEINESSREQRLKHLEAVLFVSGKFLSMQELISLTDFPPFEITELLGELRERYDKMDSALEIVQKETLWKMDVRPEYTTIIQRLATGSAEFSKAEQGTLALIAYKQPIKQSVVIKIRGNKAYDHIKKFGSLSLIKKKREGHTHILSLSDEFYDYFNVSRDSKPLTPEEFSEDGE